jgi:predicted MFS family arabinose efflux permease
VTAVLCAVTAAGAVTPAILIGFALVLGVTNAFSTPTVMAFVPSLVERSYLQAALALNSVSYNVGRAIGPVLAYVVIKYLGTAWAFGLNSLSYLALILALGSVRSLTAHEAPAVRPRLRDSIRIVLNDRTLAALLYTIFAMNLATDPPVTLGPAFMTREYHTRDSLAGLLIGAFGAGAIAAAFTFAPRLRGSRLTISATLATAGGGIVFFAVAPTLGLGIAGLFVMGIGYLATNNAATSRLQRTIDPAHRGRIMVLWSIAFLGARPVGASSTGRSPRWPACEWRPLRWQCPRCSALPSFWSSEGGVTGCEKITNATRELCCFEQPSPPMSRNLHSHSNPAEAAMVALGLPCRYSALAQDVRTGTVWAGTVWAGMVWAGMVPALAGGAQR